MGADSGDRDGLEGDLEAYDEEGADDDSGLENADLSLSRGVIAL